MNYDYLAGIIDGEGTISITKEGNGTMPYVSISNTNSLLIDKISKFLRNKNIRFNISIKKPRKLNHKTAFNLVIRYDDAIKLSKILYKKLIVKSQQAKILIKDYKKYTLRNGKYNKKQFENKLNMVKSLQALNNRPTLIETKLKINV